jgi:hypothetical protein
VDVTAEAYVERGMNPEAARAAARRKLDMTLLREEVYRMNTVTVAEHVLRTARHTVRLIRTHPGFVLTIVLMVSTNLPRRPSTPALESRPRPTVQAPYGAR